MSASAKSLDLAAALTPEPMPEPAPERAPEKTAPPSPLPEGEPYCEVESARIPHITIHVFRETDDFADTWQRAAQDRRMVSATTTIYEGGLAAAVNRYRGERTPEFLIVETDSAPDVLEFQLDALAEIAEPTTHLILVGHTNDIALYQKLLNMGVSNYMVYPVTIPSIITAISEVYKEPGKEKIGKIHAVVGAKGGVGASSVAQNVALELSNLHEADVMLVDMDLCFGTASMMLDVEPNQGLIELIDQAERVDAAMLDRVLVKRGAHLNLLGTAGGLDASRELDSFAVEKLLDVAGTHIPHIVLDIPHCWTEWVERCLTAADTVSVVTTPELAALRNAAALMTTLKGLRPNDRPPRLVLNQAGMPRRQEIGQKDMKSILRIEPSATIPHDPRLFSSAEAQGRLVTELGRKKPVAQAIAALAGTLAPPKHAQTKPKRNRLLGRF